MKLRNFRKIQQSISNSKYNNLSMPFYKGDPNINRNGRPKGAANRISEELREAFAMLLENNLEQYEEWLARVAETNPEKALDLAIRISERFIPMLSRQEVTGKDGADLFKNVNFRFGDDGQEQSNNPSEQA